MKIEKKTNKWKLKGLFYVRECVDKREENKMEKDIEKWSEISVLEEIRLYIAVFTICIFVCFVVDGIVVCEENPFRAYTSQNCVCVFVAFAFDKR